VLSTSRSYNSLNRDTGFQYDAAGNVIQDLLNQYVYDPEGRLCAVKSILATSATQYIYDASGTRVAKGTISTWPAPGATCAAPTAANGFTLTAQYLLGPGGEQVTELSGNGTWKHSNVWAGAHLDATYDSLGLHFHLADPLGTRRVQASALGLVEENCLSLPFGNGENCIVPPTAPTTADDATEHHFTGKERDTESGNDYFEARYYSSSMGRFMSPDWSATVEPVPYSKLDDPQSLNLYSYVRNNPLTRFDADGHFDCSGANAGGLGCLTQAAWKAMNNGTATSVGNYIGQRMAQQQNGDPTLPTEVQPPPPSTADKVMSALMPKSPLDLALLVGTDGLGELGAALSRALELSSAMGKTADFVTLAVTETKEGTTVVSSSEKALRPAVRALLKPGEVAANGAGHAEVSGVHAARQMGLTPTGVAASRGICPSCADFLRTAGVAALSALKGVLPF
jgi:RHS repeat-associated protein